MSLVGFNVNSFSATTVFCVSHVWTWVVILERFRHLKFLRWSSMFLYSVKSIVGGSILPYSTRKLRVPRLNERIGGCASGKSLDACSSVPSPPSVIMRSNFEAIVRCISNCWTI